MSAIKENAKYTGFFIRYFLGMFLSNALAIGIKVKIFANGRKIATSGLLI